MCNNKQPITIVRGTTNAFSVAVKIKQTGEAYVLAEGETLRFGVKQFPEENEYLMKKDFSTADEDGTYAFVIDVDDTADLPFGTYYYDVGLQSGNNYYPVIPTSPFEVTYNVTKWEGV